MLTAVATQAAAADRGWRNATMLSNTLDALASTPPTYFGLVTGGKYSGVHLGPHLWSEWTSPIREDAPPAPGLNFYVELEQMLQQRAAATGMAWNVVRPSFILGSATGRSFNLVGSLAVYATMLRELKRPLIFPGTHRTFNARLSLTDGALLTDLFRWLIDKPDTHGQAFNAAGFGSLRWSTLWAILSELFDMDTELRPGGFAVDVFMIENANVWRSVAGRESLVEPDLWRIASRRFIDKAVLADWDTEYSMDKARSFGFDADRGAAASLRTVIEALQRRRVLPSALTR